MTADVIAIDGPAASGKSTIAKKLSERLGVPYINTGNMYRAVTWYALRKGIQLQAPSEKLISPVLSEISLEYVKNQSGIFELKLNGQTLGDAIRSPDVAAHVSALAALPCVRNWMLERQRAMKKAGRIVMEGRDIGTIIFPDAKYKFFLTASPRVRAIRRLSQSGETLEGSTVDSVAKEIAARDKMDMERPVAPLKKADDAFFVDSSEKSIEEVLDEIISRIGK